jgi:Lrp/AsnC family leucine-responsive transcriptional regulator
MDAIDTKILQHLMHQGRMTWAELASSLQLSAPAIAERARRLEQQGTIRGYTALLNPEAVRCDLAAFILVTLEHPKHRQAFLEGILSLAAVQECHHIAGEGDYLLKVRCSGTSALEALITEGIKTLPGILQTRTTIVLSSLKETPNLSLSEEF